MEDLWRIQDSGVDMEEIADYAEYHRFLNRFTANEEKSNRRYLLFGESTAKTTKKHT